MLNDILLKLLYEIWKTLKIGHYQNIFAYKLMPGIFIQKSVRHDKNILMGFDACVCRQIMTVVQLLLN